MRSKTKHRPECYPGAEARAKPQERLVRLLLIGVVAVLSVFSLIFITRARADVSCRTDPAWIQQANGGAEAPGRRRAERIELRQPRLASQSEPEQRLGAQP